MTKLGQGLVIAGDIIVNKEDEFSGLRLDFAHHVIECADVVLAIEILRHGAKLAGKAAPAHVLHQRDGQITFARKEVAPGEKPVNLTHTRWTLVPGLHASVASILDHFGPFGFRVANKDAVG